VTDPVSWLQIEKGWNVVSADGVLVGKVVAVTGDEHDDNIRRPRRQVQAICTCSLRTWREGCGDLSRRSDAEDRGCGNGHARAVQRAGAPDEDSSSRGTARESDLELAARQALDARSLRREAVTTRGVAKVGAHPEKSRAGGRQFWHPTRFCSRYRRSSVSCTRAARLESERRWLMFRSV
jgi:hypothetical protein